MLYTPKPIQYFRDACTKSTATARLMFSTALCGSLLASSGVIAQTASCVGSQCRVTGYHKGLVHFDGAGDAGKDGASGGGGTGGRGTSGGKGQARTVVVEPSAVIEGGHPPNDWCQPGQDCPAVEPFAGDAAGHAALYVNTSGGAGGKGGDGGLVADGIGGSGGDAGSIEMQLAGKVHHLIPDQVRKGAHAIELRARGGDAGSGYDPAAAPDMAKAGQGGAIRVLGTGAVDLKTVYQGSHALHVDTSGGRGSDARLLAGGQRERGGPGGAAGNALLHVWGSLKTEMLESSAVKISARGGDGGTVTGGIKHISVPSAEWTGGRGGKGGDVTLTIGSNSGLTEISTQGYSNAHGIDVESRGGDGGRTSGGSAFNAPDGGAGGRGGEIQASIANTRIVTEGFDSIGVLMRTVGGAGFWGSESTFGKGGSAGAGGDAGRVSLTVTDTSIETRRTRAHGVVAESLGGSGHNGGAGGVFGSGGSGSQGGKGGSADLTFSGSVATFGVGAFGLIARSAGGTAGEGGQGRSIVGIGGDGGKASQGGAVSLTASGSVKTQGNDAHGIFAQTIGGGAGDGALASSGSGVLAIGGVDASAYAPDAAGGTVSVHNKSSVETGGQSAHALFAQSVGGGGGNGGSARGLVSIGGRGGSGGAGGAVSIDNGGRLLTTGERAYGLFAQSVGGGGGDGGGAFSVGVGLPAIGIGGSAAGGGNGGALTVSNAAAVETRGEDATAVLLQSIGGGGGNGGAADGYGVVALGTFTLGGFGGSGGAGNTVSFTSNASIGTHGHGAAGVLAQSIGGGGGNGGDASAMSFGFASVSVGGSGGEGGKGGAVKVVNNARIDTRGDDSIALHAQSIGGGGGNGGQATASTLAIPTPKGTVNINVGVGGRGGKGGHAAAVEVRNAVEVHTRGRESSAILAQSIGGGGGNGGSSSAKAITISPKASFSATVSIGGFAGGGGNGAATTVFNSGRLQTDGAFSSAIHLQSIGGGGGKGGAGAASATTIGSNGLSLQFALGGFGGNGGSGGDARASNAGVLSTFGQFSHGIHAQSIGGGGGAAAGSDGNASGARVGVSFLLGGSGGTGGSGGLVDIQNTSSGNVATWNDDAHAIFAQSIGGGGGSAGAAAGKSTVKTPEKPKEPAGGSPGEGGDDASSSADGNTAKMSLVASHAIGGRGGGGGNGGQVNIVSNGAVQTSGERAIAVHAQSIGGGGGDAGGVTNEADGGVVGINLALGGSGGVSGRGGNAFVENRDAIVTRGSEAYGVFVQSIGGGGGRGGAVLGQTGKKPDDDEKKDKIDSLADKKKKPISVSMTFAVGGVGGAGGAGGQARVVNSGTVATAGIRSDGIVAQSIGGGGGTAGAATADDGSSNTFKLTLGAGARGGEGGDGGEATVSTGASGQIATTGAQASGIVAQSIGGGGGRGGVAFADSQSLKSISLSLGGAGGASGHGGQVTIDHHGRITTAGDDAAGIIAQSIGGGGGLAQVANADAPSAAQEVSTTGLSIPSLNLSFGGAGGSGGKGGAVQVNVAGSIETGGRNAFGLLAQSIGGGGGAALGGEVSNKSLFGIEGSGGEGGNGGAVNVKLDNGSIRTGGHGATGVFAQSIGGGGGAGGDLAKSTAWLAFEGQKGQSGHGGAVNIRLNGGVVETHGANADGIFAQSVGGGGGKFATASGSFSGTAGGKGNGGSVNIDVGTDQTAAKVAVFGSGSAAIRAQSSGQSKGAVSVRVGRNAIVEGAPDTAAIIVDGNKDSKVTVLGRVSGVGGAIASTGDVSYDILGRSAGDINVGGGTVSIGGDGALLGASHITAARVDNAGFIYIGDADGIGIAHTVIHGDLKSTGSIVADVDFSAGTADKLHVTGSADIDGELVVRPASLAPGQSVSLISATNLDAEDVKLTDGKDLVFSYAGQQAENELRVQASADFTPDSHFLSEEEFEMASYLQQLWDSGNISGLGPSFTQLSGLGMGEYRQTLSSLGGSFVSIAGLARHRASLQFFDTMADCPLSADANGVQEDGNCLWGRVVGSVSRLDQSVSAAGFDQRSVTMQVGGQRALGEGWFVGGSIGYENSHFDASGRPDTMRGDSVHAGVSVKRQFGRWELTGAIDAGYGWYDTKRHLMFGRMTQVAMASPEALTASIHGRVAYRQTFGNWYVRPYVDLHGTYTRIGGYRERNAGMLGLAVSAEDDFQFAASPVLEFGGEVKAGQLSFRPFIGLGAEFHTDNSWGADARFLGALDTPFSFTSETELPRAVAKINAGIEMQANEKIQLSLEYTGRAGDRFQSHKGAFKLRYLFP